MVRSGQIQRTPVKRYIGSGRLLIHNPFSSALSKARDPYINLMTLGRLSHHEKPEVRNAVSENLALRLSGRMNPDALDNFSKAVIIDAVSLAEAVNPALSGKIERMLRDLSASDPDTPRETLLNFAMTERSPLGLAAFRTLKSSLTAGEITAIAEANMMLDPEAIIKHPHTPPEVVAKVISGAAASTPKEGGRGKEYSERVIRAAVELFYASAHIREGGIREAYLRLGMTLRELKRINPDLYSQMIFRIEERFPAVAQADRFTGDPDELLLIAEDTEGSGGGRKPIH